MSSNLVPARALSNLIPLDSGSLPALSTAIPADEFLTGQRQGYPFLSIKGKSFTVVRDDDRQLVTKADSDEPAGALEIAVIRSTPGTSKVYYKERYTEGAQERPDCYSHDGIAPAPDARAAQATSCAACPHNQWGSRITDDGKKAKACADSKRLVVSALGAINDPMLLRVPATSMKAWDQYVMSLQRHGLVPAQVATKLSFDWSVAYPMLTFSPLGVLPQDMSDEVMEERDSPTTLAIVESSLNDTNDTTEERAAAQPSAEAAAPSKPKPQAAPKATAPKAEPKPKPKPKPKAEAEPNEKRAALGDVVSAAEEAGSVDIPVEDSSMLSDLTSMIDGLDDDYDD